MLFFFLLYQFINHKYSSVDVVFVSHTADAHEVNEEQFFTQVPNGGTLVSTGLKKVEEIIDLVINLLPGLRSAV